MEFLEGNSAERIATSIVGSALVSLGQSATDVRRTLVTEANSGLHARFIPTNLAGGLGVSRLVRGVGGLQERDTSRRTSPS